MAVRFSADIMSGKALTWRLPGFGTLPGSSPMVHLCHDTEDKMKPQSASDLVIQLTLAC